MPVKETILVLFFQIRLILNEEMYQY